MRRIIVFVIVTVMALSSCSMLRNEASVENFLNEPVIAEYGAEHPRSADFIKIISVLSFNGAELTPFSDPKTASNDYRDRILAYLVNTGYSKYTGNSAKIAEAEKKYPKLRISVLVPASDFEYTVYSNFGGGKSVANKSGVIFDYLSKVEGYIAVGQVSASGATVEISEVNETENTYVVYFYTCFSGKYSPMYCGTFVKREDKTIYLGKLERVADAKIAVPNVKEFETE